MDELDEFNEAPHSLRSESSNSVHCLPHDDYDDDDDQTQNINILDRTNPGRIDTNDLISTDLLVNDLNDSILNSDDPFIANNNHFNHQIPSNRLNKNSFVHHINVDDNPNDWIDDNISNNTKRNHKNYIA